MGKRNYSIPLCNELIGSIREASLKVPYRPSRYEDGDILNLNFTTLWPEQKGQARFEIEKFVGGGFAGQVYRCRCLELSEPDTFSEHGLQTGAIYGIKIMLPPSRFSYVFRNILYWLGFQSTFSSQTNAAACRAGLLWQKLSRRAAGSIFNDEDAVADAYASFYDPDLRSWGEIREWIEGRTWLLEPDTHPSKRRKWKTVDPTITGSPEYVAKHQFMSRFVHMLHDMGAPELARQYEWWTMKSQPNVLKRTGRQQGPADGLCAVDFRAGLTLLPFLPMSPRDIGLIFEGLARGSLAQFDRPDFKTLRKFFDDHPEILHNDTRMLDALETYDHAYRRSMPDLSHQGLRLITDRTLRTDVATGLTQGYYAQDLIDETFAVQLPLSAGRFRLFYALGAVPLLGRVIRKLWGNTPYRAHVTAIIGDATYRQRAFHAGLLRRLINWHRAGRCGEQRTRFLSNHPALFWAQRLTLGFLPFAGLHHILAEPAYVATKMRASWRWMRQFFSEPAFREKWLTDQIEDGYKEGMLTKEEHDRILAHVRDPFIIKYLKCVGVHFATLPVTQIVSVITGAVVVGWMLSTGKSWKLASGAFLVILGAFQITPVSPGSICRGAYVVYLMIKERNFRDYVVAAPLSFVKYVGYLAFPIQMITTYPELAQFMASRWATQTVNIIPVFGEKGALFEHFIFDLFFNRTRILGRAVARHASGLLTLWMILGVGIFSAFYFWNGDEWSIRTLINACLAVLCLCILPRVLFYPMLRKKSK